MRRRYRAASTVLALALGVLPPAHAVQAVGQPVFHAEVRPDPAAGTQVAAFTPGPATGGQPFRRHRVTLSGVAPGDTVALSLEYGGRPWVAADSMPSLAPDWIELMLDSFWLPLAATFDQMMTGTLRVVLPREWTIMSGGPAAFEDGAHTLRFTQPALDVAWATASSMSFCDAT